MPVNCVKIQSVVLSPDANSNCRCTYFSVSGLSFLLECGSCYDEHGQMVIPLFENIDISRLAFVVVSSSESEYAGSLDLILRNPRFSGQIVCGLSVWLTLEKNAFVRENIEKFTVVRNGSTTCRNGFEIESYSGFENGIIDALLIRRYDFTFFYIPKVIRRSILSVCHSFVIDCIVVDINCFILDTAKSYRNSLINSGIEELLLSNTDQLSFVVSGLSSLCLLVSNLANFCINADNQNEIKLAIVFKSYQPIELELLLSSALSGSNIICQFFSSSQKAIEAGINEQATRWIFVYEKRLFDQENLLSCEDAYYFFSESGCRKYQDTQNESPQTSEQSEDYDLIANWAKEKMSSLIITIGRTKTEHLTLKNALRSAQSDAKLCYLHQQRWFIFDLPKRIQILDMHSGKETALDLIRIRLTNYLNLILDKEEGLKFIKEPLFGLKASWSFPLKFTLVNNLTCEALAELIRPVVGYECPMTENKIVISDSMSLMLTDQSEVHFAFEWSENQKCIIFGLILLILRDLCDTAKLGITDGERREIGNILSKTLT